MSGKNSSAATIDHSRLPEAGTPEVRKLDFTQEHFKISPVMFADQVAESKMVIRNITFPEAEKTFPHEPAYQTIELYYPLAKGGPIYADNVNDPRDEAAAEKKLAVMKKNGLRYVILREKSDLQDVMTQLEALTPGLTKQGEHDVVVNRRKRS